MPPDRFLPGADDIVVPAFFVTDENEAELLEWKREHPDWFVAGTWTPRGRTGQQRPGESGSGPSSVSGRIPGDPLPRWEQVASTVGARLDLATLSVADFMATAVAARAAAIAQRSSIMNRVPSLPGNASDALLQKVQAGPPRTPRMTGPGGRALTQREEFLEFRFNLALDRIRRVAPSNQTYVRDRDRTPTEEAVKQLETEADLAELRSRAPPSTGAVRPEEPLERQTPRSTAEIVAPGGLPVGYRDKGAGEGIQTVGAREFERIERELLVGAKRVPNSRYDGAWYRRQDGSEFGRRYSPKNGITIDVNEPTLPPNFKVHQK